MLTSDKYCHTFITCLILHNNGLCNYLLNEFLKGSVLILHKEKSGPKKNNPFLSYTSYVIALGGFLFGYDTGVINGALTFINRPDQLGASPTLQGLISSALVLGCMFGALANTTLADKLGRKRLLQWVAAIFTVSTLSCALSINAWMLIISRFILGLSVGCASSLSPLYLNEVSPETLEAQNVNKNAIGIVLGQLAAFTVNAILGTIWPDWHPIWRIMMLAATIPAILLWIASSKIPNSPFWYLLQQKRDHARRIFKELGFSKTDIHENVIEAKESVKQGNKFDWHLIFSSKSAIYLLGAGITIGFIQQASGINTVMYYGSVILEKVGLGSGGSLYGNVLIGVVSSLAIFVGKPVVERLSPYRLLTIGLIANVFSLGLLSWVMKTSPLAASMNNVLVLIILSFFLATQQGLVSPTTWLLLSEMFPQQLRTTFNAIGTAMTWLTNFVISLIFPMLIAAQGTAGVFIIFTFANLGCIFLTTLFANSRLVKRAAAKF